MINDRARTIRKLTTLVKDPATPVKTRLAALRTLARRDDLGRPTRSAVARELKSIRKAAIAAGEFDIAEMTQKIVELLYSNRKHREEQRGTSTTPPIALLKEGMVSTFGNGQRWTLRNGQPIQVMEEQHA